MIYCVVVWFNCFKNYRSQKTCQLQKDSGLYSSLGRLSLQGLSPGPVLGFSVNPRTVQNMKTDMAKTHNDHVTKQLQLVNAVCTYTRHTIYINTCTDTHTYVLRMINMWQITHIFIFELDCFMINLLDDYHNIHNRHVPTDLQKTKIAHMASSMLDIHTSQQ